MRIRKERGESNVSQYLNRPGNDVTFRFCRIVSISSDISTRCRRARSCQSQIGWERKRRFPTSRKHFFGDNRTVKISNYMNKVSISGSHTKNSQKKKDDDFLFMISRFSLSANQLWSLLLLVCEKTQPKPTANVWIVQINFSHTRDLLAVPDSSSFSPLFKVSSSRVWMKKLFHPDSFTRRFHEDSGKVFGGKIVYSTFPLSIDISLLARFSKFYSIPWRSRSIVESW